MPKWVILYQTEQKQTQKTFWSNQNSKISVFPAIKFLLIELTDFYDLGTLKQNTTETGHQKNPWK